MIPPPLRAFLYVVEERLRLGIFDGGAGGSKGASTSEGRKLQLVDWNVWHGNCPWGLTRKEGVLYNYSSKVEICSM